MERKELPVAIIGGGIGGLDLAGVTLELTVNGMVQERARGADVPGTPVASIAWLANKLADLTNRGLAAVHSFAAAIALSASRARAQTPAGRARNTSQETGATEP